MVPESTAPLSRSIIEPMRVFARYTEPFTLLIAQLAYEGDAGPELAYRFERIPS